jgi:co-chaperonin GroES (HSP10)
LTTKENDLDYSDDGNSGWSNKDTEFPAGFWDELPKPSYWRLLVAPMRPKEVSKGGIVLARSNQDAQEVLNFIGQVVSVGPMAGKHERLGGDGVTPSAGFPKVGDWVGFGRYAGQRIMHMGYKLLIINDDEILLTIPNPETLQVSV